MKLKINFLFFFQRCTADDFTIEYSPCTDTEDGRVVRTKTYTLLSPVICEDAASLFEDDGEVFFCFCFCFFFLFFFCFFVFLFFCFFVFLFFCFFVFFVILFFFLFFCFFVFFFVFFCFLFFVFCFLFFVFCFLLFLSFLFLGSPPFLNISHFKHNNKIYLYIIQEEECSPCQPGFRFVADSKGRLTCKSCGKREIMVAGECVAAPDVCFFVFLFFCFFVFLFFCFFVFFSFLSLFSFLIFFLFFLFLRGLVLFPKLII